MSWLRRRRSRSRSRRIDRECHQNREEKRGFVVWTEKISAHPGSFAIEASNFVLKCHTSLGEA